MQPQFWHDRWNAGQIAFHQGEVDRHLRQFWPRLGVKSSSPVFVPLCGKSVDLLWLRARGHSVTGVELSAGALEAFCMENGVAARRRMLGDFMLYQTEALRLFCGDFYTLTADVLGPVMGVYDRAALTSWMPELREGYVQRIAELTLPGTQTLLITLEYPQSQMKGPPFSVPGDSVHALYARNHAVQELFSEDILASEPKFRSRGLTQLREVGYRLVRL